MGEIGTVSRSAKDMAPTRLHAERSSPVILDPELYPEVSAARS